MSVIFIGHNGPLGVDFCAHFSNQHKLIGISRGPSKVNCISVQADITKCSVDRLFQSIVEVHGEIEHVIYAANSDRGKLVKDFTEQYLRETIDVNVLGPLLVISALGKIWHGENRKRSLTIVSSISALNVYGESQVAYGAVKSAQAMAALQAAANLNGRANAMLPNRFPTEKLPVNAVSTRLNDLLGSEETGKLIVLGDDIGKHRYEKS